VTLVESRQRKAVFLREASRGMANVRLVVGRAETLQAQYEWLISRAVAPSELLKLRIARRFAILLGSEDAVELRADQVIPLPWGERRMLAIGTFHVKQAPQSTDSS